MVSNGFGVVAFSEVELAAWQFNRGVRLKPWECEYLRRMSKEYAAMLSEATAVGCPPPYYALGAPDPERLKLMDAVLSQQLDAMSKRGRKR